MVEARLPDDLLERLAGLLRDEGRAGRDECQPSHDPSESGAELRPHGHEQDAECGQRDEDDSSVYDERVDGDPLDECERF